MVKLRRSISKLTKPNKPNSLPKSIMVMIYHLAVIVVLLFFDFLIRKAAPEIDASAPKLYKVVKMLEGVFAGIVYMLIREDLSNRLVVPRELRKRKKIK